MSHRPDRVGSHLGVSSTTKEADVSPSQERKAKHGSQLNPSKQSRSQLGQKDPPEGAREPVNGKHGSKKSKKSAKVANEAEHDQKLVAHDSRLHTSMAHENDRPPPPPTTRAPDSEEQASSPSSMRKSSHKEQGARASSGKHRSSSKKDSKRSSVNKRSKKLPPRTDQPAPSISAGSVTQPLVADKQAADSTERAHQLIQDPSPPVSVFVTSECSLYALRLYFFLAEKGRNYIEAPVPEPEWLAKHTHEMVGVAFSDNAATASLPSMRLIEKVYSDPQLFPPEPELEELIDFLDQELTLGVKNLLMNMNAAQAGWRERLTAAFQRLDSLLAASKSSYLLPTGFSVVDILAAVCISALPQLAFFRAFELTPLPHLEKYRSVLFSRPALSKTNYTTEEWRGALRKTVARAPVASYNRYQHVALRSIYGQLTEFVAAQKGRWAPETLATLSQRWYRFRALLEFHSNYEDEILFPALEAFAPGCVSSADADGVSHRVLAAQLKALSARVASVCGAAATSGPMSPPPPQFDKLLSEMLAFKDSNLRHMLGEEKQIAPVLAAEAEKNKSRVLALMERIARRSSPSENWLLLPLVLSALDLPSAEQYLYNLKVLLPLPELLVTLAIAERTLPEPIWAALQQRCDFFPAPYAVRLFQPPRASPHVLVLGVHTPVGEALLRLLLQHTPFAFRIALHEASVPPELTGLPSSGVQIANIDLRDPASLAAVFWGIERLFLALSPHSLAHLPRVLAAARAAGVKHTVAVDTRQSVALLASSLRSTVLQPDCLFSSLVPALSSAQRDGRLRLPLKPSARLAPIAECDVAEIAMHALAAPPPEQSITHAIAGHILSPDDIAQCFAHQVNRKVRVDPEEEAVWAAENTEQRGEADTEAQLALWRRANACSDKDRASLSEGTHLARVSLDRDPTTLSAHLTALRMN